MAEIGCLILWLHMIHVISDAKGMLLELFFGSLFYSSIQGEMKQTAAIKVFTGLAPCD